MSLPDTVQVLFPDINSGLEKIAEKVYNDQRITYDEGLLLFEKADLGFLGVLADHVRVKNNGNYTFFNRNFHFEPTNICIYNCKFCSYKRKINEPGSWEYSYDDLLGRLKEYDGKPLTEIHIVGGVHPKRDLHYYGKMLQLVKSHRPDIHIKAFTAIELDFMIRKAGMELREGLKLLKDYGLDSIPGGGAEIFNEEIRKQVCFEKSDSELWLEIHRIAHELGIPSNATILYGHIEGYSDRIDHMSRLRELQDLTGGFNVFIPLKYKKENNLLSEAGEVSVLEDLRNFAVSRIFLDNFDHIKAYWPMIGKEIAQLSLAFGVDDIDGTIDDSTKIYSMAGSEDKSPKLSTEELVRIIKEAKRVPVERDTLYNKLHVYEV
ncbi:MAG: aminofutalosine synthase MqnE [Bacteroidales bacterium]|nr:aminofutalosine synthase MqnE [Bacteroidales bacterium]